MTLEFQECDTNFRTATEFLELAEAVEYEEFDLPMGNTGRANIIWYGVL